MQLFFVLTFSANVLLLNAYGWEVLIIESLLENTFSSRKQTHYPVSSIDQLS